jgi:transposase
MITVPAGIRVLVATKPVDFRRGADSLAALVREQLKHDPFSGTIYIFRSKRADRLKIVAWDGSGLVLLWKRLELRQPTKRREHEPAVRCGAGAIGAVGITARTRGLDDRLVHVILGGFQETSMPEALCHIGNELL